MTENEMNNQAAQTMPELPASAGYLYLHNTGGVSQVYGYTADQMRAYARAALAAPRQEGGDSRSPSYDALLIIAQSVCGALARAGLTDCDDPGEAIDVMREGYEKRIAELTRPAEQREPHPDALPDGTLSKSTVKRVTALAAASVSERARDDLHVAICQAVALMNMEPMTTAGLLQAHDILRKAIS